MTELAHGSIAKAEPVVTAPERVAAELNLFFYRPNPAIKTVIVKDKGNAK